jgi:hypothetical protein
MLEFAGAIFVAGAVEGLGIHAILPRSLAVRQAAREKQ